jgi:hypothetical protein
MNVHPTYSADFYREEITRLTALLNESVTDAVRVSYQHQLASARAHLADLEAKHAGK